jgi:hypothetical protein
LDSWNFKLGNNVEITEWSSFMDRPTHKDANKIYFVFSYISTNFCEFLKSESIFGNYLNAKGIEKGNHEMCRIRPTALVQMTARPAPLDGPTVAPSPAAGPAGRPKPSVWRERTPEAVGGVTPFDELVA